MALFEFASEWDRMMKTTNVLHNCFCIISSFCIIMKVACVNCMTPTRLHRGHSN